MWWCFSMLNFGGEGGCQLPVESELGNSQPDPVIGLVRPLQGRWD